MELLLVLVPFKGVPVSVQVSAIFVAIVTPVVVPAVLRVHNPGVSILILIVIFLAVNVIVILTTLHIPGVAHAFPLDIVATAIAVVVAVRVSNVATSGEPGLGPPAIRGVLKSVFIVVVIVVVGFRVLVDWLFRLGFVLRSGGVGFEGSRRGCGGGGGRRKLGCLVAVKAVTSLGLGDEGGLFFFAVELMWVFYNVGVGNFAEELAFSGLSLQREES